jgi:tetratricopeptide (TPR) repeat protein
MNKHIYPLTILILIAFSCENLQQNSQNNKIGTSVVDSENDGKIMSFLGEELPPKSLTSSVRRKYEQNLKEAQQNLSEFPDSLDLIIWHGRRLAYLGRYLEAIKVYSDGLTQYPQSYKLRRNRGHVYITTRQINKAVEDFEMAAFHSKGALNAIEPDGLPNKLNKPLGNDFFNIWYHFGLAHYLNGRYDKAISAYNQCMKVSDNNDLKVATSYWLFMSYKKIGNQELAEEILVPINFKMKMIENNAYLELLLLFKGEKIAGKLLAKATLDNGLLDPTLAYGIGNWYQQNGENERANEVFLQIMDSPNWESFGYIAAEKELTSAFPVPLHE